MFGRLNFLNRGFYCLFCREPDPTGRNLCRVCEGVLRVRGRRCPRCALPIHGYPDIHGLTSGNTGDRTAETSVPGSMVTSHGIGPVCGFCVKNSPPVERTVCALSYTWPATQLIHQLKFQARLPVSLTLGILLAESTTVPDRSGRQLMLPVPLSHRRFTERGYNQAREIARFASHHSGIPVADRLLCRTGDQLPQTALDRSERRRNIRGAFSLTRDVAGQRVILVDDVMTTGATVFEAARTLKRAGAKTVDVWVVARTDHPG